MNRVLSYLLATHVLLGSSMLPLYGRSIYRPSQDKLPEISTRWLDEKTEYRLRHIQLEESALFHQFDAPYFESNILPDNPVAFRNQPTKKVSGARLKEYIEELVKELQSITYKKKEFAHFTVLKQRDYNPVTRAGLIVLRFKKYPFIVKLFMETPESFVHPFTKGFEPICFFMMGGGINRYLAGFSRVKNGKTIQAHIDADPYWRGKINTPRKWYWRPKETRWFELTGKRINEKGEELRTVLPSIYAVICDAIDPDYTFKLRNEDNRKLAIQLSHFFGARVDPHINNFMIEKYTGKIVLIDTEHFPTMVGLREPLEYDNYLEWYAKLIGKCLDDTLCRSKKHRRRVQKQGKKTILAC
jgi:hypothetical protein